MTDKAMPELKPCPFCGPQSEKLCKAVVRVTKGDLHGVSCINHLCKAQTSVFAPTREEADELWNTRHQEALDVGAMIDEINNTVWLDSLDKHQISEIVKKHLANRLNTPIPESRKIALISFPKVRDQASVFREWVNTHRATIRGSLTHPAPKDTLEALIEKTPVDHSSAAIPANCPRCNYPDPIKSEVSRPVPFNDESGAAIPEGEK